MLLPGGSYDFFSEAQVELPLVEQTGQGIRYGKPAELLQGGIIELKDPSSVERPDDINCLLVKAGTPPTQVVVEEEELEQYFLRLVGMDGELHHE